jgi:hypothetical protein
MQMRHKQEGKKMGWLGEVHRILGKCQKDSCMKNTKKSKN